MDKNLENRIKKLEQELKTLQSKYAVHQHNDIDGTLHLRKNIMLDRDQFISVGAGQMIAPVPSGLGTASEFYGLAISVGSDSPNVGFVNKSNNMQMDFYHFPNTTQSFLRCYRKPLVASVQGTSISTTASGNTVTIAGFNFTTNELAGALINIFNSSGVFIETQTIASNTSTVITISGTWLASTSDATFLITIPVFLGSAEAIFQRNYVQEGTAGGLRFGVGPTTGGQNGLLYMDATGDLYWRNKAGTSVKLN